MLIVSGFNAPLQEKHLQHLKHLLIDISRLKEEMGIPSKHIHVRICTLDPGTLASRLVTARTVHFMPERKRTRLALVSQITSEGSSRQMIPLDPIAFR